MSETLNPQTPQSQEEQSQVAGRRHHKRHSKRHSHHKNSWLTHVKATMKLHRDKSFKQVLKIAKKTYKRSQSQSQTQQQGGKRRRGQSQQQQQQGGRKKSKQQQHQQHQEDQHGGSGGKESTFSETAATYPA
jgi:hypothetical protein